MKNIFEYLINRKLTAKDANKHRRSLRNVYKSINKNDDTKIKYYVNVSSNEFDGLIAYYENMDETTLKHNHLDNIARRGYYDFFERLHLINDRIKIENMLIGISFYYSNDGQVEFGFNPIDVMENNTAGNWDFKKFEEFINLEDITPKLFIDNGWM